MIIPTILCTLMYQAAQSSDLIIHMFVCTHTDGYWLVTGNSSLHQDNAHINLLITSIRTAIVEKNAQDPYRIGATKRYCSSELII